MNRRIILKTLLGLSILPFLECAYGITQVMYADGQNDLERRKKQLRKDGHKIIKVVKRTNSIYEIQFKEKR